MPTIVVASGTIVDDVRRNTVGTPPKHVAEARLDTGDGYYTVVCWEKLADQLPDSGMILVHGRLRSRSYENKDKVKVWVVEVVASGVEVLGAPAAEGDDDLTIPD